jgi:RNA polymerase sigma-70 factor (ECF subfamily)
MRQGDEGAFEELYNRYWKKLYNTIYSRTKSVEWSEGIVQDFFTSLWLKREQLRISTTFEAYAFTAVRYHLFHYIQKEVTRKKYSDSLKALPVYHPNPTEETVLLNDLNSRLSKAITRLPEKCRSVFELSRREHKSNREIAEELGISEKTVENHLTRALKYLRLNLKEIFLFLF